jgi:nucleoside-diphosphate-sugar epimerase
LPQDDPRQRRPDIAKARELLGWNPGIDLESGLNLSLEYFQQAVCLDQNMHTMEKAKA